MTDKISDRLKFWDGRAKLGFAAGSNDINLKKIEIQAIKSQIPSNGEVLDAGCGNGFTLFELATSFTGCKFTGFDYSSSMIEEASRLKVESSNNNTSFFSANLLHLKECPRLALHSFDCVYTQRSLINLDSFADQLTAIESLWKLVKPGGRLVICESFNDGLEEINHYRNSVELPSIQKPWHNTYFDLHNLPDIARSLSAKPILKEFSGSYYFVSRVINAWQSHYNSEEPSYSSPVNLMSLSLPVLPVCGQSKLVVFEKN